MHLQAKEPPKVVSNPDTRGKAWNTFSLRASRRNQPCWYSDLGFLASRTSKFPLFEATHSVVLCYSSHRKLIHHVTLHWQHVSVLVPSQTHQHLALSVILILAFLQGSSSTECAFKGELLKPHLGAHILRMSQSWWSTRSLPARTGVKSIGSGVRPPGSNPVSTPV